MDSKSIRHCGVTLLCWMQRGIPTEIDLGVKTCSKCKIIVSDWHNSEP